MARRTSDPTSRESHAAPVVAVRVRPRTIVMGGEPATISITVTNPSTGDLQKVAVEWEAFSPLVVQMTAESPAARRNPRARSYPHQPLSGRLRRLPALSPAVFSLVPADRKVEGILAVQAEGSGRFQVRVTAVAWVDAQGQAHRRILDDVVTTLQVEEPTPPDLWVTIRCGSSAALGEPLPLEVRVDNRGSLEARGLVVEVGLPAGLYRGDLGASLGVDASQADRRAAARLPVSLGPVDVPGHQHASWTMSLVPDKPGDACFDAVRLSWRRPDGQDEALDAPPMDVHMAVRVDPSRVFVGRDRHEELSKLFESIEVPSGTPASRVVLVGGQAGMGKSRLLDEMKARARFGGYFVAESVFSAAEAGEVSALLRNLVSSLLGMTKGLHERLAPGVLEIRLSPLEHALPPSLARDLRTLARYLYPSLGSAQPGLPAPVMSDPASFLVDLFRHVSRVRPLLLAIDDLQAASSSDRRLLSRVLAGTSDCPVLALLTWRREQEEALADYLEHLRTDCGASDVFLDVFNYEACYALVSENFVGANFPDWLVRAIHTRSHGVPLYEVEAMRCLILDGLVRFDPLDGWKADRALVPEALADLPGTPGGLVARQISSLRGRYPEAFQTLQDAAVLDTHATPEILAEMEGGGRARLRSSLQVLAEFGLIRQVPLEGVAVEFTHPVKREMALPGSLELLSRNRAAAQAIAQVWGDTAPGAVAAHWMAADRRAEALPWLLDQARRSMAAGVLAEAMAVYGQAWKLLDDADMQGQHPDIDPVDILRPLLKLQVELGSAQRALDVAERLQAFAQARQDRPLECEAAVARARSLSRLGRDLEALQAFYAASDLADACGRPELDVAASLELSEHYRERDRERSSRRVLIATADKFLALSQPPVGGLDAVSLVASLCRSDCIEQALRVWQACFAARLEEAGLHDGEGKPWDDPLEEGRLLPPGPLDERLLRALRARSFLIAYTHGEETVTAYLERALAAWLPQRLMASVRLPYGSDRRPVEEVPDDEVAAWLETLCRALWLSGDSERALDMLDASWLCRERKGGLRHRARYLADRANLLASLERGREAASHSAEYVQVARQLDEPLVLCDALLNAAYLTLGGGDISGAESTLHEAMALAGEKSLPSLLCRSWLLMAGIEMARGQAAKALGWCRQAVRLAQDHDLSPELTAWAATETARSRAAMGEVREAAEECAKEAERLIESQSEAYALSCLRAEAGYFLGVGDLDGARKALEKAVSLPGGRPGAGREREQALRELGEVLLRQGDVRGAVENLRESLQLVARRLGPALEDGDQSLSVLSAERPGMVSPLEHLAMLCERLRTMGKAPLAQSLLERALESVPPEDTVGSALLRMYIARLTMADGDLDLARQMLQSCLDALGPAGRGRTNLAEVEKRRRRVRVLVRLEMARLGAAAGELDRAIKGLRGAMREAQSCGDPLVFHEVLVVLGRVHEEKGNVDEARAVWEKVVRGVGQSHSSALRLEAHMGLARIAMGQHQMEEAAERVKAAEAAATEAGWMGVGMMLQVAEVWEALGDPERALGLLERSLSIVRLAGVDERARLPALLQTVARLLCHVDPPRLRDGIRAAEEAVDIARLVGDPNGLAENLEGMAQVLLVGGEEARAVEHLQAALNLYERLGNAAGAGRVRLSLTRWEAQAGDLDAARAHLVEAMRLGEECRVSTPTVLAEALLMASSLAHEQGLIAEATSYLLRYLDIATEERDTDACVAALAALDDLAPGWDLGRVSQDQWKALDRMLKGAASNEVVECRLAGVKGMEAKDRDAERNRWLDEALHAARKCQPGQLDPSTLDDLARALEQREDFLGAANVYRALLAASEATEDAAERAEMRAYACGRAGELLAQAGQVPEALALYLDAERHAQQSPSFATDPGSPWNAFAIGSIYLDDGKQEEAREWFRTAVQRWVQVQEADTVAEPEERYNMMAMQSLSQALSGQTGDALATLERFRCRVEGEPGPLGVASWLSAACDLTEALVRQKEQDAAWHVLMETQPYVERCDLPDLSCRVWIMMSWLEADRGDVEKSFTWADRALPLAETVQDNLTALQVFMQAAALRDWIRDGKASAPYHRRVIDIAWTAGDWKLTLEHQESLIVCLAGMGDLEGALEAWEQMQGYRLQAAQHEPEIRLRRPRYARAMIHLRAGETDQASALLLEDIAEARQEEDAAEDLSFLYSWLGSTRHAAGELASALEAFEEALGLLQDSDGRVVTEAERDAFEESAASVYLEMCEIHACQGRWSEADEYLVQATDLARLDPWVRKRLPEFSAAVAERRVPPHADPLSP